jgi:hypothetical protein
MGMSLEQFAAECRRILESTPGPAGRKKVGDGRVGVLKDDAFIAKHVGDDVPERKILYEDPTLGFCILAHNYLGAKESQPHDHGPVMGHLRPGARRDVMSDWTVLEPATEAKAGQVKHARSYPLKPGDAHVYNEGDVHSPRREGPTKLIRIEGHRHVEGQAAVVREGLRCRRRSPPCLVSLLMGLAVTTPTPGPDARCAGPSPPSTAIAWRRRIDRARP